MRIDGTGFKCAVVAVFCAASSFAATINIEANDEHELSSAENVVGNTLSVAGNATLKLAGSVTDGTFALNPAILFSGAGTLTIDT